MRSASNLKKNPLKSRISSGLMLAARNPKGAPEFHHGLLGVT